MSPFAPFLDQQGYVLLDGGLATALEAAGADLNDPLWSARVLAEQPELLAAVHRAYLDAGADCIATGTYQATVPGLTARGYTRQEALDLMQDAVNLALDARDRASRPDGLTRLVAASLGPYGAYLADGSEYSGNYGLSVDELRYFHADRWAVLAASGADLIACETIPSFPEVQALLSLLDSGEAWAWISLSCRDAATLHDGTPLADVVDEINHHDRIAAVGANCLSPGLVPDIILTIRRATDLPIVVYPNSGEVYRPTTKDWAGERSDHDLADDAASWLEAGARVIGGCCRTLPATTRAMRERLSA